jgi:hypothetical protein
MKDVGHCPRITVCRCGALPTITRDPGRGRGKGWRVECSQVDTAGDHSPTVEGPDVVAAVHAWEQASIPQAPATPPQQPSG